MKKLQPKKSKDLANDLFDAMERSDLFAFDTTMNAISEFKRKVPSNLRADYFSRRYNYRNQLGKTLLTAAAESNNSFFIERLVRAGASVRLPDSNGKLAIDYCLPVIKPKIVRALYEAMEKPYFAEYERLKVDLLIAIDES